MESEKEKEFNKRLAKIQADYVNEIVTLCSSFTKIEKEDFEDSNNGSGILICNGPNVVNIFKDALNAQTEFIKENENELKKSLANKLVARYLENDDSNPTVKKSFVEKIKDLLN